MRDISPLDSNFVDVRHHVGDDVRALRKSRGMTITELADLLERSIGWLSQVERGQTNPSIPDIRQLAAIFEIPVSFFFRNDLADDSERGLIVRKASRASLGSRQAGLTEELLSPDLSGDFEIVHSTFEAGAASTPIEARPTLEAGYLVSGRLTLQIGQRVFDLEAGDSFQFQNEPYCWTNKGDETAVVIWVISPPIY